MILKSSPVNISNVATNLSQGWEKGQTCTEVEGLEAWCGASLSALAGGARHPGRAGGLSARGTNPAGEQRWPSDPVNPSA